MEKLKKFLKVSFFVLGFYALINVGSVFAYSISHPSLDNGTPHIADIDNCVEDSWLSGNFFCTLGKVTPTQNGDFSLEIFSWSDKNNSLGSLGLVNNAISGIIPTPTTPTRTTAGIFLPIDDETGEQVGANALMASVGTATSDTVGNIAPVAVVVMSLILAFMFIVTLIGLVKKTDGTKDTKKRI